MIQKSKTHYEEVPLEIAQKIAEEQIATQPAQVVRSERYRGPTRKRPGKRLSPRTSVQREQEGS